ncbi:unnamed protein product [Rotaria magnacalcarata]|uniref:Uncharacterized protein n=2 Tax=Rotaria TaxID=231623 RepID=A0A816MZM2_9BILA|nr:unnamed protein product [Rotaria magnacalcarata]CAF1571192.1 unnamed protein product [Rotaria magnacalcarata]CAF2015367.1 unnamed protein product [Rotaria magnacalcarata]CAF2142449.1 unnamed protein product [Rotaria magnacalcarata]CAF2151620.1 unnamed protein product [Rotaria magnacalcarata]
MIKYILLSIYLSLFMSLTNGITCTVCSSETSSACADPFDSSNASFLQLSGYNYCQKNVFANGLITRFGESTCLTSNLRGITTAYCCSNRDNCNYAVKLRSSLSMSISFIISFMFFIKFVFH